MTFDRWQESYRIGSPFDLAEKLGEKGIAKLLELACEAYYVLYRNRIVKPDWDEYDINEELTKEIKVAWKNSDMDMVVPQDEKSDRGDARNRGRPRTIDFVFRDRWVRDAFFGFEFKILAEGDNGRYDLYIQQGLYRYIHGEYCSKGTAGSMIGYIKFGSSAVVVNEIMTRVNNVNMVLPMVQAYHISCFKEHYVSTHHRENGLSDFRVHHLFFSFVY